MKRKEENKKPAMDKVPQATGWRIVVLPHKGVEKTKVVYYLPIKQ